MTSSQTKGHYPLLWVTGPAGSGKTPLATKAIDSLKSSQRLAYFYCDAQDANKRSFLDILRNWCWQLLSQDQARLREVKSIKDRRQMISGTVLIEVLGVILSREKDVVLVIDDFDECETQEQAKLYHKFSTISQLAKLLVFSRPLQGSVRALQKAIPENLIRLEISEGDTKSDINQFIERRVADLGIYDTFILAEIISMLQSKTNGTFL
ncbi:Vegetative incompatibility protein HET-E-1 [Penicillium subrubescens]|uniref:Vegetative incompatibility protein HET-E-1 n=2 Tax=Penicillium subrubescens TaxID=1316194 RepID=A0A1Q5UL48_9EURO|nr:Vegetative incompatibility protein HET-E-1 [Penicillium subrubescens]